MHKEEISAHVEGCEECRFELERIDAVLKALDTLPVPDPGSDYGRRVWQQIAPRLSEKPSPWWHAWFEPRRLAAVGGLAALIIAAFFAGRITRHPDAGEPPLSAGQVREKILVVAVGEHLGRSEMMLMELSNAEPKDPSHKQVNISTEQHRAEDLLEENRLYRQTALQELAVMETRTSQYSPGNEVPERNLLYRIAKRILFNDFGVYSGHDHSRTAAPGVLAGRLMEKSA